MDVFKGKLSAVIEQALKAAVDTVISEITQLVGNEFADLSERVKEMKQLRRRLETSERELKQLRGYFKPADKNSGATPPRVSCLERDFQPHSPGGDDPEKESGDVTGVNASLFNEAQSGSQRLCTSQAAPSIKDWPLVLLITPEIVTEDNNQELLISDQSVDTWIRSIVDRAGIEKEAQEETVHENVALQAPEQHLHQEYCAVQSEAPQGSVQSEAPQGSVQSEAPQGSVQSEAPQGSVQSEAPQGSVQSEAPQGSVQSAEEVPLQGCSHTEEQVTEVESVFIIEGVRESPAAHIKEELPELESVSNSKDVPDMESLQMKEEITEEHNNNEEDENDGSIQCKEEAHAAKELSAGAHNESTALGEVRPEAPVHGNGQVSNDRSTDDTEKEKESSSVENLGNKDCAERGAITTTSVTSPEVADKRKPDSNPVLPCKTSPHEKKLKKSRTKTEREESVKSRPERKKRLPSPQPGPGASGSADSSEQALHLCATCGKGFSRKQYLTCHQRSHSLATPHRCTICGDRFKQLCHLKTHQRLHQNKNSFRCNECNKSFIELGKLKTHQKIHKGGSPHHCKECGKSFALLNFLKRHKCIRGTESPFRCSECGKCFANRITLGRHAQVHTGEKPYHCNECGKTFMDIGGLKKHQRVHTGVTPYLCTACGKSFSQIGSLKVHHRTHTGEKPFYCNTCGKSFKETSTLLKHQKLHAK
ncbi:zinc finger and SCAN domain-containing protein 12-like [Acipenser ruthenus]|uniref:zinc finger and SCAN domain-containing protein 12-like n=1 Tax=Acipenser ruthenus TaxID=7906 RepID=UPI0027419197|nr:zinc finger and SCAN domain-containing protein 12-like [Acipenser ruthenus]